MKTKEEALCTMKGIEALLIALSQYTEKMECDPDALFVLSKSLTECREYFEENQLCKRVPIFIRWDTQGMEEVKEQVIKEQREGFFASSIEFIKRIIGKEGSYMEKKY